MCQPSSPAHASRQALEVADIFRAYGEVYRATHALSGQQLRVMRAIELCRTAALGGHLLQCDHCGAYDVRYHSCRNRHCPKCQRLATARWVEARVADLLPIPYFHCVFTLPHALNPVAQGNPRVLYALLFQTAWETLQTFGRDPKWLGGDLGATLVLHTWGQNLDQHLHVHCLVTGGALATEEGRWIPTKRPQFLFPVHALSKVFRGKYLDGLQQAFTQGRLHFAAGTAPFAAPTAFQQWLGQLWTHDWVVYAKAPFAGPQQVVTYLGRYTHRIAISNERLVALEDGMVHFRWRDYRQHNAVKVMALSADEFIRRFLSHVLPRGLQRLRHYGVLGNRGRAQHLPLCRTLLGQCLPVPRQVESTAALMHRLTGMELHQCPSCRQGCLRVLTSMYPAHRLFILPTAIRSP
jgi:putative transposase/transposase-like zinc-binding protein